MDTTEPSNVDTLQDSPGPKFPKRGLPEFLSSAYPHGHLSGKPRSTSQQHVFELKKANVLETMDAAQIEAAYQETVRKVLDVLEQNRRLNEETDRKVENLKKSRETELKVINKMMESQGKRGERPGEDESEKSDAVKVKEEIGDQV